MDVVIIGLGYVGLPLAIAASKSGINVIGFDIDKSKISNLRLGIVDNPDVSSEEILTLLKSGNLKFEFELTKSSSKCTYIIAVPTPLNNERMPEMKFVEAACQLIAENVAEDSLIVSESTSYIGTLRNFIMPLILNKSGRLKLHFAVAPERIDPGNNKWSLKTTPRILSGISDEATSRCKSLYSKFCEELIIVSKPEVAEAAKLFENTFRQVNIALANQFYLISSKFEISANEAIVAASTKPFGFMPFFPGIGVGGHCIPVDPSYLIYSANTVNESSSLIAESNSINKNMAMKIVSKISEKFGGDIIGKKIQVIGISYKTGVSDLRESPAIDLINELQKKGASVIWHDPKVKIFNGVASSPITDKIDLGLIVTPHEEIDLSIWKYSGVEVLDLSSINKDLGWPKFY